jgi:hypothetical protein
MNNIAITPYVALHALQIQNVKRNVVKKIDINELKVNTDISREEPITNDKVDATINSEPSPIS